MHLINLHDREPFVSFEIQKFTWKLWPLEESRVKEIHLRLKSAITNWQPESEYIPIEYIQLCSPECESHQAALLQLSRNSNLEFIH